VTSAFASCCDRVDPGVVCLDFPNWYQSQTGSLLPTPYRTPSIAHYDAQREFANDLSSFGSHSARGDTSYSLLGPGLQPGCRITREQVRFRVLCACHRLVKNRADNVSCLFLLLSSRDWTHAARVRMRWTVSRMSNDGHEFRCEADSGQCLRSANSDRMLTR